MENQTSMPSDVIMEMPELEDQDEITDIKEQLNVEYLPTVEQQENAIQNFKMIFDPKNTMNKELLYEFIDNGCLDGGRITLQVFIQQTCTEALKGVETEDGEKIITVICQFFNDLHYCQQHTVLSQRIFEVLCSPIKLYENSAFMQIWGDLLNTAFEWRETAMEQFKNNHDPYEFPFTLSI